MMNQTLARENFFLQLCLLGEIQYIGHKNPSIEECDELNFDSKRKK